MINLDYNTINSFILYVDTIDNEIETFEDYFLLGFTDGFNNTTTYVVPTVLARNSRYLKLSITLTNDSNLEDAIDSLVYMVQGGNWDYTLYNTASATLDPTGATVLDTGQMVLNVPADSIVFYNPDYTFGVKLLDNETPRAQDIYVFGRLRPYSGRCYNVY